MAFGAYEQNVLYKMEYSVYLICETPRHDGKYYLSIVQYVYLDPSADHHTISFWRREYIVRCWSCTPRFTPGKQNVES